jgi:hypothetical protein
VLRYSAQPAIEIPVIEIVIEMSKNVERCWNLSAKTAFKIPHVMEQTCIGIVYKIASAAEYPKLFKIVGVKTPRACPPTLWQKPRSELGSTLTNTRETQAPHTPIFKNVQNNS